MNVRFFQSIGQMLGLIWRVYPAACIGTALMTITQGLLPLATAWIAKVLFDQLALQIASDTAVDVELIVWLLGLQVLLTIMAAMLPNVSQYLNAELQRRVTLHVQKSVHEKINSFTGIAHFENPKVYDTIQLAQQGAEFSASQALSTLTQSIQSFVTLLSFIGVLFTFNIMLASLVFVAAMPQFVAQIKLGQQRFGLASDISMDERRKFYYGYLLTGVDAAKEIRLFGLGRFFLSKLLALYKRVHQAEREQEQRELRWELGLGLLSSLVAAVAFVFVVLAAFAGNLTLGDVSLYVSAVGAVQGALSGVIMALANLNESVLFYSYYQDLLALQPALPIRSTPQTVPPLKYGLELRNVSFRYHEDLDWVLRHVNLTIPSDGCLALVGLNGAGKTTLVKLLTRLYDPTEGEILWDGINIKAFAPDELRGNIGAIFQDFMRYDLTVRENIGLGNLARINDHGWIEQITEQSNLAQDVARLPQAYETEITRMFTEESHGFDLSGGQWQKIATARMFAREADLLILDEPTAALDAESEYEVYSQFSELMTNCTSVLISHRFSTVRMAKVIAVLEEGRITESGSHDELMHLNGSYAKLYQMQAESYL